MPAPFTQGPIMKKLKNKRLNGAGTVVPASLSVYDGTALAGFIVERAGEFTAFNADNEQLGTFQTQRAASRAIPTAPTTRGAP
jgi:hypothetical protein